jgi:glutathione S-transferase
MKLYTKPGACSLADHIALIWAGLPFELEVVDYATMKSPAYLAMNPSGAVPVLTDGDWVLTQNAAILNYIAALAPAKALDGGSDPRTRAEVARWLAFFNADLHPQYFPLFGSTKYLEDEAVIARTHENSRSKLRGLHERADAQLAKHQWIAGTPKASIADAYFYVTLRWARGLKLDLSGLEAIARFEQQMLDDPAVQAALKTEGLV